MEKAEAKSAVKAIYLQAASLAGLEASAESPERLVDLVETWYAKVAAKRRPEAVANMLRIIAASLDMAQKRGDGRLHEDSVKEGEEKVCPVYPFPKKG
jgi:hypothetical protein